MGKQRAHRADLSVNNVFDIRTGGIFKKMSPVDDTTEFDPDKMFADLQTAKEMQEVHFKKTGELLPLADCDPNLNEEK